MNSKKVRTDTGSARLYEDGSMIVFNSGFRQKLTKAMVNAIWKGAKKLPHHPNTLAQMKKDGLTPEEMSGGRPYYDGMYWTFDEQQHEIPSKSEFFPKKRSR